MRFYSWNVNGFRSVVGKGFWEWFNGSEIDVLCLQEIKVHPEQLEERHKVASGYEIFWNPSRIKNGYSGTACFHRFKPLNISTGLPTKHLNNEGRLILMEYKDFYLFNVYFPNGQMNALRLKFKLEYYDAFLEYAEDLRKKKPIVVCGDFNTAHKDIDLKNPRANQDRSGFLPVERQWLDKFVNHGYVDTFRMFNSDPGHYTWWSYRFGARARNAGWRIDYFFVSSELTKKAANSWIEPWVTGSDHCPVGFELKI